MWIRASLAQLVEHALRKRMVMGSIPIGGSVGKCLKRRGSGKGDGRCLGRWGLHLVRKSIEGPVAQWIRHRPMEPGIVGSSPTGVT